MKGNESESWLLKMHAEIVKFCNGKPASGFENEYLQKAEELLSLYTEANTIAEEDSIEEQKLEEIYKKIKDLV